MLRVGRAAVFVAATCTVTLGAPGAERGVASTRQAGGVVQLDLVDTTRPTAAAPGVPASPSRSLPTTVHLPPGSTPAPLIVLAHGAGGSPERFTELAAAWAGAGYVVAAPRFPLTNADIGASVLTEFGEQGRDVRFVIDELVAQSAGGGELAGRVDGERIGLFGLSLGSLTVWSAALAAPPDQRVDVLIQSDGTTLADDVGAVPFPVLVAHSDVDPIFPYADVVARYDELPGAKYLLTLVGAAHASVGENTITPADAIYREATTAFWDRTLGGIPDRALPGSVDGVATLVEGERSIALPGTR